MSDFLPLSSCHWLQFRVGLNQQKKNERRDGEHARGGVLTVPDSGLPRQEPFSADGDEGDEPQEQAQSQRSD